MSEVRLTVELPPVQEEPQRMVVRCGETTAEVYEYAHVGSGNWAAWSTVGRTIGDGYKAGCSFEQAVADARAYVRREEHRRLLHAELRRIIDTGEVSS